MVKTLLERQSTFNSKPNSCIILSFKKIHSCPKYLTISKFKLINKNAREKFLKIKKLKFFILRINNNYQKRNVLFQIFAIQIKKIGPVDSMFCKMMTLFYWLLKSTGFMTMSTWALVMNTILKNNHEHFLTLSNVIKSSIK